MRAFIFVALLAINGALAAQPAEPLSLTQAQTLARRHRGELSAAQARLRGARFAEQGARALPAPTLSLAHAFGSQNTGGFDEDVILGQSFEPFKRGANLRQSRAEIVTAQSDVRAAVADSDFQVASAYYALLRARAERDLAAEAVQTARTFAQSAAVQEKAGDVARRDVLRAQIELLRARESLENTTTDAANAGEALAVLLGLPPGADLQLRDAIEELAQIAPAFEVAAVQSRAAAQRADLQSAQAELQSRRTAVEVTRAAARPDFFVEARRAALFSYNGLGNGYALRAGVTLTPFDWGRQRAAVRAAQAEADAAQARQGGAFRAARSDVQTALNTYERARAAVAAFQKGRLQQSKELLDMMQTGYEHGASSALDVLDARTVHRAEQADYLRAQTSLAIALADLRRAAGGTLPGETAVNTTP